MQANSRFSLVTFVSVVAATTVFLALVSGCGFKPASEESAPTGTISKPTVVEKAAWEEKWEKIVKAGKEEGTITVYTSSGPQVRTDVAKAFRDRYGLNVEWVSGRPPELLQKVTTERRAGIYAADVFITGSALVTTFKPSGVLDPIGPALILPELVDPKGWMGGEIPFFDKERSSIGFIGTFNSFMLRNTDMVKPDEITSHRDLAKPQWKGKIVLQDPDLLGAGLYWVAFLQRIWGQTETRSFLQELKKQDAPLAVDARLQVEWVARGKYPVSIGARLETTQDFINAGAPLRAVKVIEGGLITPGGGGVGLPNRPAHPNGAIIFINWLLSKEGQTTFARAMGNPSARIDVSREGFSPSVFPDPGEKTIREDEDFVLATPGVLAMFKEIFRH